MESNENSARLHQDREGAAAESGASDGHFRFLAENIGDVFWTLDPRTMRYTYISPSISALRGLSVEEALAERIEDSLTPESLAQVSSKMAEVRQRLAQGDMSARASVVDVYKQPCKDGSFKWIEISTRPIFDAQDTLVEIVGVSRDATARVLAEEALNQALVEKDRLYAELQHRVKNSLTLIVSLLSLEAASIDDEEKRAPIEDAQARVRSIGLLYEQLYKTRSVEDIDLGEYLAAVARYVIEITPAQKGIRLECDCAASLRIATDRAVSVGLILYEIVANAVKHGLSGGKGSSVTLSLKLEGKLVSLSIADDGIGLPAGFDLEAGHGLGSLLISQLVKQLGGEIEYGSPPDGRGAHFMLRFPLSLAR